MNKTFQQHHQMNQLNLWVCTIKLLHHHVKTKNYQWKIWFSLIQENIKSVAIFSAHIFTITRSLTGWSFFIETSSGVRGVRDNFSVSFDKVDRTLACFMPCERPRWVLQTFSQWIHGKPIISFSFEATSAAMASICSFNATSPSR